MGTACTNGSTLQGCRHHLYQQHAPRKAANKSEKKSKQLAGGTCSKSCLLCLFAFQTTDNTGFTGWKPRNSGIKKATLRSLFSFLAARCTMGPCRIIPPHRIRGVCGADTDLIVARNLLDTIATGAAAHSDHGRDIVETLYLVGSGKTSDYGIADPEKLRRLCAEYGISTEKKSTGEPCRGTRPGHARRVRDGQEHPPVFFSRAPKGTREIWSNLGISPRGIDREVVDCMHRIQMGVGADYVNILLQGLRCSLSDGWGGSMLGTDVSDILFGTPSILKSRVNLAVLREDHVNIAVHGHNPVLSEMVVRAVMDPEMIALAKKNGALGINLVGLCCTGSEMLMRKGIPMSGNHLNQELVITTGALEAMIVDYQCIFPSLPRTASCFHTLIISTSSKAKIPGSYFFDFSPENGYLTAKADCQDGSGELQKPESPAGADPRGTCSAHDRILQRGDQGGAGRVVQAAHRPDRCR